MDSNKLRYLAERGHLGHAALLDPDAFLAAVPMELKASPQIPQQQNPNPNETAFQQAVRELPGDVIDAFSPAGIARTTRGYYETVKGLFNK